MSTRKSMVFVGCLIGIAATVSLAQVATPPPAFVPRPETVIPPAPPPPRPVTPKPRAGAPEAIQVPNIPYVSILRKDAEGKVIRISGNLDLLALKHNPTVGPETIERIRPAAVEWIEKIDALVRDNLDLVADVDGGLFETMDFANEQEVMQANEIMKALITVGGLNNYLLRKDVLERVQFDFNARLAQEYKNAVNVETLEAIRLQVIEDTGKEDRGEFFRRGAKHTFRSLCEDAVWSYHRQLQEAAAILDSLLPKLELQGEAKAAAEAARAAVNSADDSGRLDAMRALMAALDFDKQQQLLLLTAEANTPRDVPQLDDAANKPDGAAPREPDENGNVRADP